MLYHHEIGFPAAMRMPQRAFLLEYTQHTRSEAQGDRYGAFALPMALDTRKATLIEAEVDETTGEIIKAVWRLRYDDTRDVVLVVLMRERTVKTVWINTRDDGHETLDKSRYTRP